MYGLCVWSWALTLDSFSTLKERARGNTTAECFFSSPHLRKLSSVGEEKICIL